MNDSIFLLAESFKKVRQTITEKDPGMHHQRLFVYLEIAIFPSPNKPAAIL